MEEQNNQQTPAVVPEQLKMSGLYVTAFLLAEGGVLVKSWKDDSDPEGKRKIFLIAPPEGYRQKLKNFKNGIAVINVMTFIEKIKALKKVIHDDPV